MSERSQTLEQHAVSDAAPAYQMEPLELAPNQVPARYKRTDVGVIPEDWNVIFLGDLATFRTGPFGTALHKSDYIGGGVPLINPMHIENGQLVPDSTTTVSEQAAHRLAPYRMRPDDIVIARRGEMGRCAVVQPMQAGWLCGTGSLVIRCSDRTDAIFIQRILTTERVIDAIEEGSVGSTMTNLNQQTLSRLQLQLPSLLERRAIATALSDADALIESLGRLIAKKRAIKQAAMQQLLTGQTRLPGFAGEWEVKQLGDISHIKTGNRNNQDKVEGGAYPFFVRSEYIERINSYAYDCEAIVIPGEGRIGDIFHYINGRFDVHQRVYAITQFHPDVSSKFVYYYMASNFGDWAMRNTVKATVDSLRLPTFSTFELPLPPTKEEQTAIATVLSDMDAEIKALERRRDKARQIKQGMMQQLLTGRVRLVEPEQAA